MLKLVQATHHVVVEHVVVPHANEEGRGREKQALDTTYVRHEV